MGVGDVFLAFLFLFARVRVTLCPVPKRMH